MIVGSPGLVFMIGLSQNFNKSKLRENYAQKNLAQVFLVAAALAVRRGANYARHRAITSVMSSCWSLPLLNCWTAKTTVWRRRTTGR